MLVIQIVGRQSWVDQKFKVALWYKHIRNQNGLWETVSKQISKFRDVDILEFLTKSFIILLYDF